jgi:hypothetical protein
MIAMTLIFPVVSSQFVEKMKNLQFSPADATNIPGIRKATSIVDGLARGTAAGRGRHGHREPGTWRWLLSHDAFPRMDNAAGRGRNKRLNVLSGAGRRAITPGPQRCPALGRGSRAGAPGSGELARPDAEAWKLARMLDLDMGVRGRKIVA